MGDPEVELDRPIQQLLPFCFVGRPGPPVEKRPGGEISLLLRITVLRRIAVPLGFGKYGNHGS